MEDICWFISPESSDPFPTPGHRVILRANTFFQNLPVAWPPGPFVLWASERRGEGDREEVLNLFEFEAGKCFEEMIIPLGSCPQSGSSFFLRSRVPGRAGGW